MKTTDKLIITGQYESYTDGDGRKIVDLSGGFGFQVPPVIEAVSRQASIMGLSNRVLMSEPTDWLVPNPGRVVARAPGQFLRLQFRRRGVRGCLETVQGPQAQGQHHRFHPGRRLRFVELWPVPECLA